MEKNGTQNASATTTTSSTDGALTSDVATCQDVSSKDDFGEERNVDEVAMNLHKDLKEEKKPSRTTRGSFSNTQQQQHKLLATIVTSNSEGSKIRKEIRVLIRYNGDNEKNDNTDPKDESQHISNKRKRGNTTDSLSKPTAVATAAAIKLPTAARSTSTTSSQQPQHILPLRSRTRGMAKKTAEEGAALLLAGAEDGNDFLCHVCNAAGDVVCCDGCPNVYHAICLPDGPSKDAIDADPWFCPDCFIVRRKKQKQNNKKSLPTRNKNSNNNDKAKVGTSAGASTSSVRARWSAMEPRKLSINKPSLAPSARSWKTKRKKKGDDKLLNKDNKVKKKRGKNSLSITSDNNVEEMKTSIRRPIHATPAFFFFLRDNLKAITKKVLKNDSSFNDYYQTGSFERNRVLAQEGAKMWSRLSLEEQQKYTTISMKDFEQRVRDWKKSNNNNTNSINWLHHNNTNNSATERVIDQTQVDDETDDGDFLPPIIKQPVSVIPSIKSSSSTYPQRDGGANSILLDLLHDVRFHPIPMLVGDQQRYATFFHTSNIDNANVSLVDDAKLSIPSFEVQGPISTCVGDKCLGCARGWCHFCPILKKQFPAVKHRSKLQPPLSSLAATRIGLIEGKDYPATLAEISDKQLTSDESHVLDYPNCRDDEVIQFITHCLDLKKSAQSNQQENEYKRKKYIGEILEMPKLEQPNNNRSVESITAVIVGKQQSFSFPVDGCASSISAQSRYFKCKCGTLTEYEEGCVSCRRSLLVNAVAFDQSQGQQQGAGSLDDFKACKLQTLMIPRLVQDPTNFEKQREGDKAIAAVLSGSGWKPNAIMPHRRLPSHHHFRASSPCHNIHLSSSRGLHDRELLMNCFSSTAGVDGDIHDRDICTPSRQPAHLRPNASPGNKSATAPGSPPRRLRSRNAIKIKVEDKIANRQAILKKHKDEENDVQRKCLSVALCGIFLGLVRRDPQRLFAEPVSESVAEYHKIVKSPMDFHSIRSKILSNQYSFGTFIADVRLLCSNALAFNPPQSIYATTAQRILGDLELMQQRASDWMSAIKNTLTNSFHSADMDDTENPFAELRQSWPGAVELMEEVEWYRAQVRSDFLRTRENESAYYGSLAIQRAAAAAAAAASFSEGSFALFNPCVVRSASEDEQLRQIINMRVAQLSESMRFLDEPSWREDALVKLLRKVQSRRVENIASKSGCARCDGVGIEEKAKLIMAVEAKTKGRGSTDLMKPRIDESRISQSTAVASLSATSNVNSRVVEAGISAEECSAMARNKLVSVRGSHIHGWGLFAEQPVVAGEVVAEYVGEYVSNAVADSRERKYQELRIQDYQFRVEANLVIDATMKGGCGRYINHCCDPNCIAQIIDGDYPQQHLKRVLVIARRDVKALEEITYDYQFPLENNLDARIPCNCGAVLCRGFMNWDLPEKGINTTEVHQKDSKRGDVGKVNSFRRDEKLRNA